MSIDQKLQSIFRDVFDNDAIEVRDDLSPETFADWDSFHQVKLVIAIEEDFEIKFTTDEAVSLKSVAQLKAALRTKGVE